MPAARRALGTKPIDAIVGHVPTTPEVAAARSEVAVQVPAAQVHGFHRPALVLNPRSGSAQAVRAQLLEAAGRYGVQLHEAETPAGLVALVREAIAEGADVLGVAGGDGSLAAVAAVAIEAFVAGPERRVDVATVGERLFLNNAPGRGVTVRTNSRPVG